MTSTGSEPPATVALDAAVARHVAAAALEAVGASPPDAAWTAELLVRGDETGHGSHGLRQLPGYVEDCRAGRLAPAARGRVERLGPSLLAVDGERGLGQVVARTATQAAMDAAREHGVAVATVRRSGHAGRLADYAEMAAAAGLVALLAANDSGGGQVVAPAPGWPGRLSTNPIAVGVPRAEPPHLVVDLATSAASLGTVELWRALGRTIPDGWTSRGPDGTTTLLPLAGHKGLALALVVEVLAGVLSGAGHVGAPAEVEHQGLLVVVLDPARLRPLGDVRAEVEAMLAHVLGDPPPGATPLRAPGRGRRLDGPISLDPVAWVGIAAMCRELGLDPPGASDVEPP